MDKLPTIQIHLRNACGENMYTQLQENQLLHCVHSCLAGFFPGLSVSPCFLFVVPILKLQTLFHSAYKESQWYAITFTQFTQLLYTLTQLPLLADQQSCLRRNTKIDLNKHRGNVLHCFCDYTRNWQDKALMQYLYYSSLHSPCLESRTSTKGVFVDQQAHNHLGTNQLESYSWSPLSLQKFKHYYQLFLQVTCYAALSTSRSGSIVTHTWHST